MSTLARALVERPEIRSAQKDVEIEERQLEVDRSETRPHVELFTGYEVYSESDPKVGPEFNHGYVVGVNASWALFDGFATRGRMQATRARRDGALLALKAVKLGIESEVRSAFLDLQQADSVLESQTKNVQTADEALAFAKRQFRRGTWDAARYSSGRRRRDEHPDHAFERDLSSQCRARAARPRVRPRAPSLPPRQRLPKKTTEPGEPLAPDPG